LPQNLFEPRIAIVKNPSTSKVTAIALCLAVGIGCGGDDQGNLPDPDGPGEDPIVWLLEDVPTRENLFGVWGRSATEVWAVGDRGTILFYNGLVWTAEVSPVRVTLTAVDGSIDPDGPIFAVGWDGTVLERRPTGEWIQVGPTPPVPEHLFGVSVGSTKSALVVGEGGRVLGWDDTNGWQTLVFQVPGELSGELITPRGELKGVWSRDGRRYYLTGAGGAAFRSANGFQTFEAIDTRISEPLRGVWGTGNDNVYTVGLDGLILQFTNQWRRVNNNGADSLPKNFFFAIDGLNSGDITVVGWRGAVARFKDGAWVPERTDITNDFRDVWVDPETEIAIAVGATGTAMRRDPPPPPEDLVNP
jgi:hypothetical protein